MSPYRLKSDLVAFVICSGNKIDNGKKENLRIKFSNLSDLSCGVNSV